ACAQVARIQSQPALDVELGDPGVAATLIETLICIVGGRQIARVGYACDVGEARGINRDAARDVHTRATEISRAEQRCEAALRWIELGDERVVAASARQLRCAADRKIIGGGVARDEY